MLNFWIILGLRVANQLLSEYMTQIMSFIEPKKLLNFRDHSGYES